MGNALKRGLFILGTPFRPIDIFRSKKSFVVIDEGPVSYLSSVGCCGPSWNCWARLLVPHPRRYWNVVIVFLNIKEETRRSWWEIREGRKYPPTDDKKIWRGTGKERVSMLQRKLCYDFYRKRLEQYDIKCVVIDQHSTPTVEAANRIVKALLYTK